MDFLTPLNITMSVVLIVLFVSSLRLFSYRALLKNATMLTGHSLIKTEMGYKSEHRENIDNAQEDLANYNTFWIPLFYTTLGTILLLWLGFSLGIERNSTLIVMAVAAVSTVVTRAVAYDPSPPWLTDWITDMAHLLATQEADTVRNRAAEIVKRAGELVDQASAGKELTDEEQQELLRLVIEEAHLRNRAYNVANTFEAIQLYQAIRKEQLAKPD